MGLAMNGSGGEMQVWLQSVMAVTAGSVLLAQRGFGTPPGPTPRQQAGVKTAVASPSAESTAASEHGGGGDKPSPAVSQPLSLADAVEMALARHPSLEATRAATRSADA